MNRRVPSRTTVAVGLGGGIVHAVLALWSSGRVRGRSVWELLVPGAPTGVALVSVTVLGLVLLGGVPIVLFSRNGLVTPLLTLLALFAWSFYASWQRFEEARATGATPIDPYYDSLFGLFWFVPLALVLGIGSAERFVRTRSDAFRRGGRDSRGNS